MCALTFSTPFIWNTSRAKKKPARYRHKCENVFMESTRYICRILMTLEFSRQIFEKVSNIKFHQNPSSMSRTVPCRQTDRQTDMKLIVAFRTFSNAPKNTAGVVQSLRAGPPQSNSQQKHTLLSSHHILTRMRPTRFTTQRVSGAFSPCVKRPRRKWILRPTCCRGYGYLKLQTTVTSHCIFLASCLIWHWANLAFILTTGKIIY